MGLGMAGLWFMNRQRGSQEDQVDQLAGAAMMASGEGTAPDAPFQTYSAPSNPSFFFNQGGQMTEVPGTGVPIEASSGEDIGIYPGGGPKPELEFEIERSDPPAGTTDITPTTPQFAGSGIWNVKSAAIWDYQSAIAEANFSPLLAVSVGGNEIDILGSSVDIATISSKEQIRIVNLDTGFGFQVRGNEDQTAGATFGEYVRGFIPAERDIYGNVGRAAQARFDPEAAKRAASSDEDIGGYPGGGNKGELEFTVARSFPPNGTSDISPTTPQFAGTPASGVTASTIWDQPSLLGGIFSQEGGAFGPSAVETGITSNIKSTVRPEPSVPVWAGGNNWWDEG
jgi:hypothetical protein